MTPRAFAVTLAAVLACSRAGQPSREYAEARRLHADLVAAHPADAAAQPAMDEVLRLLAAVPPRSPDAAAASELRARIEADRKALADESSRRGALVEQAGRPPAVPHAAAGAGARATASAPAPTPSATGGVALAPGARVDDLRAKGGDCFEKKAQLEIVQGGASRPGEAWGLKETPDCAAAHPADAGRWLLFADGGYVSAQPASAVKALTVRREQVEVQTFDAVPLPGGGWGRKLADGTVVPLPKDAQVTPAPAPTGAAR